MDELRLIDVIEQALPYDGPHSADTVEDAARGMAYLGRYLNNATGPWNARQTLRYAPTVEVVLGGIESTAYGWDQLLRQLAAGMQGLMNDPTMYDDRHDRPALTTATEAVGGFRTIQDRAAALAAAVSEVRGQTGHLGHNTDSTAGDRS